MKFHLHKILDTTAAYVFIKHSKYYYLPFLMHWKIEQKKVKQ